MFKYYLNMNNAMTYNGCYEVHKKNCPIVKQAMGTEGEEMVDIGFYDTGAEAMKAGKDILIKEGIDPDKINGCLACNKECHRRE